MSLEPEQLEAGGGNLAHISVEDSLELLRAHSANPLLAVIDVRTPEEYAELHMEGAALMNCHDADFIERLEALPRENVYLMVCRSGNRSGRVLEVMRLLGFAEAYNMLGGMRRWVELGLPVVGGADTPEQQR